MRTRQQQRPPWTPARLASRTMICWFDAADTPSDGTALDSWRDRGPLRLDLSQGSASLRPIVRQYGRSGERGKASVGGDNTDDIISRTGITTDPLDGADSAHVFAVVSITSAGGYWMSFAAAPGGNGLDFQNAVTWHRRASATLESVTGTVTADGHPRLVEAIYDDGQPFNTNMTLLADDAQQGTAGGGPVNLSGFGELHLCNFSNGFNSPAGGTSIHELIVFAERIAGEDRTQMIRYLAKKWGAIVCAAPLAGQM